MATEAGEARSFGVAAPGARLPEIRTIPYAMGTAVDTVYDDLIMSRPRESVALSARLSP
jgi:hypothetical protein